MNLAHNAVEHTERGRHDRARLLARRPQARIWVADTARASPAEDHERIFERFAAATRRPGLGLAIVRTIADAHGGRIELRERAGQGATFTIVLPAS